MSNLTLKLDQIEDLEIDKLKSHLGIKTTNGVLRYLISNYLELNTDKNNGWSSYHKKNSEFKKLKKSTCDYFDSMQNLMKVSEFEQKL